MSSTHIRTLVSSYDEVSNICHPALCWGGAAATLSMRLSDLTTAEAGQCLLTPN